MQTQSTPLMARIALLVSAVIVAVAASAAAQHQHGTAVHRHPAAAKLKNPVAANPASIAAGQKLYEQHCAECHGASGKGDGKMADDLDPKPANLADAEWKHGSTDGEIFTVIRDGIKNSGMKAYGKKLSTQQTWHVVNYVRSLGPVKSH